MSVEATAAVVRDPAGEFSLETVELDALRPDEILVRVQASGVCHTDAKAKEMVPTPAVLGHEGTGVVEEIGSRVGRVRPGDRVIISYPSCGACAQCRAGALYLCDRNWALSFDGSRLDGSTTLQLGGEPISSAFFQQSSFATRAITLERSVVPVDDETPPELLAALPCGILTGAGSVLNALRLGAQDSLVVFGVGAVGLSAVMAARVAGVSPLIAVDVDDRRLSLALELGATHAIDAKAEDTLARVQAIAPRGIGCALDTSGTESAWAAAVRCLRMGATVGIVTGPEPLETAARSLPELFRRGGRLQCILLGFSLPNDLLPRILEWHRQGRFPFDRLITTFEFARINEALAESAAGRAVKPVLLME